MRENRAASDFEPEFVHISAHASALSGGDNDGGGHDGIYEPQRATEKQGYQLINPAGSGLGLQLCSSALISLTNAPHNARLVQIVL